MDYVFCSSFKREQCMGIGSIIISKNTNNFYDGSHGALSACESKPIQLRIGHKIKRGP